MSSGLFRCCLNFWDEVGWFLSWRVFGLLSSSLLLFPQRFGRYVLRPFQVFVVKISETKLVDFYHEGFSDYCLHLYCYFHNVLADMSSGLFRCLLSKFLRRSLLIFIMKGFRTIVFIFIVISTIFRPICSPAFSGVCCLNFWDEACWFLSLRVFDRAKEES